ncbi:MAG TPA: hypothetical protein VIG64_07235 [Actinomycetota bacterium]
MGRHDTDFVSAIAGILFLVIGGVLAGGRVEADDFSAMWALPAVLIAVGLVVAAVAANRFKSGRAADDSPSNEQAVASRQESSPSE